MADVPCIHCSEQHPSTTTFCPNTGARIGAAGTAASAAASSAASSPEPPTIPDLGVAATPELGVLDLLQRALDIYKKHAKTLLAVAAVVFVPGAIAHACARAAILAPTVAAGAALERVAQLPAGAVVPVDAAMAGLTATLLGMLAAAVTGLFLHGIIIPLAHGALAVATADRIAGGHAGWQEIWTLFMRRLGTVLSAIVPAALLVGAGFFFLVLPGLILAFFFSFVPTIALFEGIGGTAALRRSYQLVRSDWLRMLLVVIVFGLIFGVARIIAGILSSGLFGSQLVQDALTLVAMPIPVIASVLLYFDVRRKKEGFDDTQLEAEMAALRAATR